MAALAEVTDRDNDPLGLLDVPSANGVQAAETAEN
jgi:hypothetical protein